MIHVCSFPFGVTSITCPIPSAPRDPSRIPREMVTLTNAPTWPLYSPCTVCGAFTAHRVPTKPFVKAQRVSLRILNQSAWNSQAGEHSKATARNVARKIVLAADISRAVFRFTSTHWSPPMYRPARPKPPNMVTEILLYQLSCSSGSSKPLRKAK